MENIHRAPDMRPVRAPRYWFKTRMIVMDEAISRTEFGLFNYVLIFVSAMVLNVVMMETCSIGFAIPVLRCDLTMTAVQKGMLASACFAGIICGSYFWGYLVDTKGRRAVIRPTLLTAFLITVASSFAQNVDQLAFMRLLNGFFISGSSATIYAYLGEFHSNKHRDRAIMMCSALFGASCLLLPLLVWLVMNGSWKIDIPLLDLTYKPWRLFIVVCGLPGFLAFLILCFLPESPKFVLSLGKQFEAYHILQRMNQINNGKDAKLERFQILEESESIENRRRASEFRKGKFPLLSLIWNQTAPLFKPPYLNQTLFICFIQFWAYFTANGFYMLYADVLNRMVTNVHHPWTDRILVCDVLSKKSIRHNSTKHLEIGKEVCISKLETETLGESATLEILFALSLGIIGVVVNRVGKFPILVVFSLVPGICGIVCVLIEIPLVQKITFIILMLSCVAPNVINAAIIEVFPTTLRGMAVSLILATSRLGAIFGAIVSAYLLDKHCESAFYLSGISLTGVGILTYFIPKIHERAGQVENNGIRPRGSSILSAR